MTENEIIKHYEKGDFTVVWKPKTCIHAAECVKRLPEVYDPKGKPWIKPENASVEALKEQIDACPSGALTYIIKGENSKAGEVDEIRKVEVIENGPLLVYGTISVTKSNGTVEEKNRSTAFCRCGASENKPYCDGAHNNIGFVG